MDWPPRLLADALPAAAAHTPAVAEAAEAAPPPTATFVAGTVIFVLTYLAIAFERKLRIDKTVAALVGSSLMLFFILPGGGHARLGAYSLHVDFNVIFLLAGMMIIVNILSDTGLFQYLAIMCAKTGRGRPLHVLALLLCVTAILSAFLDNVTTVLLLAPVTLLVAQQLKVNPVPFLVAEALASNIGGTATLIGDPPNILIGSYAGLDFLSFLRVLSPLVLVLMAGFVGALAILLRGRFRTTAEQRARVMDLNEKRAIRDPALLKRAGTVTVLTLLGFLVHGWLHLEPAVVAMGGAAAMLAVTGANLEKMLQEVEWPTLFFFLGLFIVVNGAVEAGLIGALSDGMAALTRGSPYLAAVAVLWGAGLLAGIMNNVSFTAAALPVVGRLIAEMPDLAAGQANALWWALALGACLGGNLTPVGAAANLVVVNLAGRSGYRIGYAQFARWGVPTALASLAVATVYVLGLVRLGG
jgi:Na+/H+ antiporter NhaD/arsenite permease-like protein